MKSGQKLTTERRDRWTEAVELTMEFMTTEFSDLSTAEHLFVVDMLKHFIMRTVEKSVSDFDDKT